MNADYHIVIAKAGPWFVASVDEIPGYEAYEPYGQDAVYLAQRRVGKHADARGGAAGKLITLIDRTKP